MVKGMIVPPGIVRVSVDILIRSEDGTFGNDYKHMDLCDEHFREVFNPVINFQSNSNDLGDKIYLRYKELKENTGGTKS